MSVFSVKQGVKAYTNPSDLPDVKKEADIVGADQLKEFGVDNIGDLANKLSDPNWVDPSKKMRTTGDPNLDKDAFFKMMLAQMKNQDPTNPLKSHEMAAQLANFSSLEQMTNMNQVLQEIKNAQKPTENFQALNLIGKAVAGDSSSVVRGPSDKYHDFKFNLPADAEKVEISLKDDAGRVVREFTMRNLKKGENKLTWNGQDEKGRTQPVGEYKFSAQAIAKDGNKLALNTQFDGLITGVSYSPEGPVLHVGQQSVKFRDVKKITDPRLKKNDQNLENNSMQDLKATASVKQTENVKNVEEVQPASAADPKPVSKIMDEVGLSNAMMNKLAKETSQ